MRESAKPILLDLADELNTNVTQANKNREIR